MSNLVAICPTRERPSSAARLAECFQLNCTADTELLFAVDESDPTLEQYKPLAKLPRTHVAVIDDSTTMVFALNAAAKAVTLNWRPFAVGFLGDDHRPHKGWDTAYLEELTQMRTGIVYGDDLFQGKKMPTQWAMTSDIIEALGWMVPPSLRHLFVDNWILALGEGAQCIRYLPDVIVEHLHPVAHKAEWDEGYARVNSPGMYRVDQSEFHKLVRTELDKAVAAIREVCDA